MATDREGNTINVGDRVVLVAKIASANGQDIVLGNRDPLKVKGEDVLIETELGGGGGVTDHGALTGREDPDHPAGAIAFTATDLLVGRATAGAGAGEEIACTAPGRAILAAASAAAQRSALAIASEFLKLDASNGPLTGDLVVGTSAGAARTIAAAAQFSTQADLELRQGGLTNARLALLSTGELQLQFDGASLGSPVAIFGVTASNLLDMKSKRVTAVADPTSAQDAATKAYVDAVESGLVPLDGSEPMTGDLDMDGSVVTGLGTPVDPTDGVSLGYIAALLANYIDTANYRLRWLRQQECPLWITTNTGWTNSTTGSGAAGLASGQFFAAVREPEILAAQRLATGTATAGTNAAVRYTSNNNNLWMPDGRITLVRIYTTNASEVGVVRLGFFGNATLPGSTGRPDDAIFLEYDESVDGNWHLVTTQGGTPSTDPTGVALSSGSWSTFAIEFVSDSSVKLWSVSDSGSPVELAEVTTNIMSSNAERAGGLFGQVTKTSSPTSSNGQLIFQIEPLIADPELLSLP